MACSLVPVRRLISSRRLGIVTYKGISFNADLLQDRMQVIALYSVPLVSMQSNFQLHFLPIPKDNCTLRVCERRVYLEPLIFRDLILCMRLHFFIPSEASSKYVSASSDDSDDTKMVSVSAVLRFLEVVDCRNLSDFLAEPEGGLLSMVE